MTDEDYLEGIRIQERSKTNRCIIYCIVGIVALQGVCSMLVYYFGK